MRVCVALLEIFVCSMCLPSKLPTFSSMLQSDTCVGDAVFLTWFGSKAANATPLGSAAWDSGS